MSGVGASSAGDAPPRQTSTTGDALGDLVRAAAGGMLFGIPLLYTMEVWWIGSATTPAGMAAVFALTFVPVVLLIHTAGFRRSQEVRWADVLTGAVEAVAIGVVAVAIVLILLQEITPGTPLSEVLGKTVYEVTPFALGAAVARHIFSQSRDQDDDATPEGTTQGGLQGTVADLGATLIGAVFVGFNIAPTDEIPMLAAASSPASLLAVMAASLLISYAIVFQAGFGDQAKRRQQQGVLQHPFTETVAAYLVALACSAAMLVFFRNLQTSDPWPMLVEHTVLLGLPAAVGGSAGRLAV
jgi:putative integral membrane protein (TIGR02587 family)